MKIKKIKMLSCRALCQNKLARRFVMAISQLPIKLRLKALCCFVLIVIGK
jgi:hypothetical protein